MNLDDSTLGFVIESLRTRWLRTLAELKTTQPEDMDHVQGEIYALENAMELFKDVRYHNGPS